MNLHLAVIGFLSLDMPILDHSLMKKLMVGFWAECHGSGLLLL